MIRSLKYCLCMRYLAHFIPEYHRLTRPMSASAVSITITATCCSHTICNGGREGERRGVWEWMTSWSHATHMLVTCFTTCTSSQSVHQSTQPLPPTPHPQPHPHTPARNLLWCSQVVPVWQCTWDEWDPCPPVIM